MAIESKIKDKNRVMTGKVRFSYLNVFIPKGDTEESKRYSVSLIIPKEDTLTIENIKKVIKSVAEEKKASVFNNKLPSDIFKILHDGDEERSDDEAYKNSYYINAYSKRKPEIINRAKEFITDPDKIWSGDYGLAFLSFYAYNNNSKGVACNLDNLMLLEKGEPLGAVTPSAESDFSDINLDVEFDFGDLA